MNLDELRRELDQLDGELMTLIARRQAIARQVAAAKRSTGYPTRDYEREREVILGVRSVRKNSGCPVIGGGQRCEPVLAQHAGARQRDRGLGQWPSALVSRRRAEGGWFVRFMRRRDRLLVADPAVRRRGPQWQRDVPTRRISLSSLPTARSRRRISMNSRAKPPAGFRLGSLESALRGANALKAAGVKVTHCTMF